MTHELRIIDVFHNLSDDVLSEIAKVKTDKTYNRGEVIFYEGTQAFAMYGIYSGRVKVYKTEREGKRQILRIAGPGGVIGDRSAMAEELYHVTASPIETAHVCIIGRDSILSLMLRDAQLSMNLAKKLSAELKASDEMASRIANRPVRARMAGLLLMLNEKFGILSPEGARLDISLNHEELGEMIGVSRETANRALSRFRNEKAIVVEGSAITLIDLVALAKASQMKPEV